jgi:3-phosphoglycerate kinase
MQGHHIIGGGDSASASRAGFANIGDPHSTGAALPRILGGKELPGVAALNNK